MTTLTEDQLCELSCFMPNLACVIEREPPAKVEETRAAAREELAAIMNEMKRLRVAAPVTEDKEEWLGRFSLSDEERRRAEKFVKKHPYGCHSNSFTIRFDSAGPGTRIVIKCKSCGKKRDISEYEAW